LPVAPRVAAYAPYLLIPPLFLAIAPRTTGRVPLRELAVVFALWLPIEFGLLPALPLPAPNGFDMRKLVGLVAAMYVFLVARPLPGIGYTYRLTARDLVETVEQLGAWGPSRGPHVDQGRTVSRTGTMPAPTAPSARAAA
jgi:hypothetical protein